MANRNTVGFGLKPYNKNGSGSNSTGTGNFTMYEIANGNTNEIFKGSVVIPLASGFIDIVGAADGGTVAPLGVFMGCEFVSSTTGKPTWSNSWPGSGANSDHPIKAYVADDPNQVFVIQSDATLTNQATARASVFLNADMILGTSGSSANGQSTATLRVSTLATTAGLMLRLMGWIEDPDNNDFSAAGVPLLVRFTTHFNADSLGIAVGTPATTGV
mgnify:FL=1